MASISIDAANLCIKLVCGVGETDVTYTVDDIYEAWKDWVLIGTNSGYPQAMDSTGGDPLGGGEKLGLAYFLKTGNGWLICPETTESQVKITLVGNLFSDPAGQAMFGYDFVVSGGHTHIEIRTSSLPTIIETGVSGLTPTESTQLSTIETVESLSEQILSLNEQINKLAKLIPGCVK